MCDRFAVCFMLAYSLDGVEIMLKILFKIQVLLLVFLLGKFSYFSMDGKQVTSAGIFIPNLGGYHLSLSDSDSGFYN